MLYLMPKNLLADLVSNVCINFSNAAPILDFTNTSSTKHCCLNVFTSKVLITVHGRTIDFLIILYLLTALKKPFNG